jgi:chromosome segregation ATPase
MSQVEKMASLFPRCPICGSYEGYDFSAFYPQVMCRSCGSQWTVYEHEIELKSTSESGLAKDLLNKRRSLDFWRSFEAKGESKQPTKGGSHELVETLRGFQKKIEKLKKEKAALQMEIEKLNKVGEKQIALRKEETTALEEEVSKLKKELKSLQELIGTLE